MIRVSKEIRGIDEETLRGYLTRIGGEIVQTGFVQPGEEIRGAGWAAWTTRLPDYRLGQAAFCCVRVEMEGEDEAVRKVWKRFELRILRPGG